MSSSLPLSSVQTQSRTTMAFVLALFGDGDGRGDALADRYRLEEVDVSGGGDRAQAGQDIGLAGAGVDERAFEVLRRMLAPGRVKA